MRKHAGSIIEERINKMNKKDTIRNSLIIAFTMLLLIVFTGCSKDEVDLLSAIMSAPRMTSYEYEGSAAFEIKFDFIFMLQVSKPLEQGDSYSVEFVHIIGEDSEKIETFQKRYSRIGGFEQHPLIEVEPTQFPIEIQLLYLGGTDVFGRFTHCHRYSFLRPRNIMPQNRAKGNSPHSRDGKVGFFLQIGHYFCTFVPIFRKIRKKRGEPPPSTRYTRWRLHLTIPHFLIYPTCLLLPPCCLACQRALRSLPFPTE